MPFVSVYRPSLQLGLLKALASAAGFDAQTFHLNLHFAELIGVKTYEQLVHHRGRLFGDWLFSVEAFGDEAPDPHGEMLRRYIDETDELCADIGAPRDALQNIRRVAVPQYIDAMRNMVDWGKFRVVGFTSTFQQNSASFALARRIKLEYPNTLILFGGSNFEGEMGAELVRGLDFIDYAISGEADEAFREFLNEVAVDGNAEKVTSVLSENSINAGMANKEMRPMFNRLDTLPVPDYREYFERSASTKIVPDTARRLVYIPFESARGCWWGQKHHCTFCGLNGSSIGFRSKSPGRVKSELASLAKSCGSFRFEAVDNILDMAYFNSLIPEICSDSNDYTFFYEVKSNLTKEKIKMLSASGVRRIQPGIESLDSQVLRLMRKGVTGIQNVNLLRWSLHYDIDVGWNIIWGFPGERATHYQDQLRTIQKLRHLQPPTGAGRIWMERFSPIFTDRTSFPAEFVQPESSYQYVYPKRLDLNKIAYFFDYKMTDSLSDEVYADTRDEVNAWQESWKQPRRPTLLHWSSPGYLQIEDLRDTGSNGVYEFYDELAALYLGCGTRPTSAKHVKTALGLAAASSEVEKALDEFVSRGLMLREGSLFLSLALPASRGR